jgi:hypothetical protein
MTIEDRPLNELELDCIVALHENLRKDSAYIGLLDKRNSIKNHIDKINHDYGIQTLVGLIDELRETDYEIGFWEGKEFGRLLIEKLKKR